MAPSKRRKSDGNRSSKEVTLQQQGQLLVRRCQNAAGIRRGRTGDHHVSRSTGRLRDSARAIPTLEVILTWLLKTNVPFNLHHTEPWPFSTLETYAWRKGSQRIERYLGSHAIGTLKILLPAGRYAAVLDVKPMRSIGMPTSACYEAPS